MSIDASLKILVVDDCLDTRNYIKQILRKQGFKKVISANDGQEGLDTLKQSLEEFDPISLVLADWQMPQIDGLDFLTKVRIDNRFKDIPFIMVTADNDKDHLVQAINYGVDNYLVKPIKPEQLLQKIVRTLEVHPPPKYGT